MEVSHILSMNGGEGESSYSRNSLIQKEAMFKARPVIEESVKKLLHQCSSKFKDDDDELCCFRMADFGCSSGPNTLLLAREVMDIVDRIISTKDQDEEELNCKVVPMFQIFLNDLPGNDFNTLFMSIPSFCDKLREEKGGDFGPCFVAGVPGSFYGRLFPDSYLHFAYSSYSLHWRSQVPEGLVSEAGLALNRGNIYLAKTSHSRVFELYLDLFKKDLTNFLRSRSQEMVPGSQMVLVMMGSDDKKAISSGYPRFEAIELLGTTLNDMVLEGLIEEAALDQFNLPFYAPTLDQLRQAIEDEGSFSVEQFGVFEVDWDANIGNVVKNKNNNNLSLDKHIERGKYVAMSIRVVVESLLACHFGSAIMDHLFQRFARKIAEYLELQKGEYTNIVISMAKKGKKLTLDDQIAAS